MPPVIYTFKAVQDLVRLRSFLQGKSPEAASRAVTAIRVAIKGAALQPERFRPVPDLPFYREILIEFGATGYVVRFRYEPGGSIVIVRVKHQLEEK